MGSPCLVRAPLLPIDPMLDKDLQHKDLQPTGLPHHSPGTDFTLNPLDLLHLNHTLDLDALSPGSLQFLNNLWEGVNYGIFLLEVLAEQNEFRYLAFNPAIARSSPIPVEQLLGKTVQEALPAEMADRYRQHFLNCIQSGESISFEEYFQHHGQETWWLLTVTPLRNPQGEIIQILVTAIDISDRARLEAERQAAEQALAESEAKFRRLVEEANDFLGVWTLDGVFTYLSPSFQTMFGFDPAEWIGHSFASLVHPEDLALCEDVNRLVISLGTTQSGTEFRHRHKNGHWVWVSINVSPVKNPQGQVVAIQGILRDISDRRSVEDALRSSQAELLALFNAIQDVIIVLDRDGRYLKVAPSAAPHLYKPSEELMGKTMHEVLPQAAADFFLSRIQQVLATGTTAKVDYSLPIGDREIWFDATIAPLDENSVVCVARDISDRKAAEADLQRSYDLLQNVVDSTTDAIFVKDDEHRYVIANAACLEVFGRSAMETIGNTDLDILPPAIAQEIMAADRRILDSGIGEKLEELVTDSHGVQRTFLSTKNPMRDRQGKVIGLVGVARDISDRKATEVALQDYADRQTLLNQLASQIRRSLDIDTVIATTIQSIRDLLALDHCAFAWYHPEHNPPVWELIQEAKLDGTPSNVGRYPARLVGPIERMLLKHEILCINDVENYPEPKHRRFLKALHCRSEMLLPIQTHSNQLGILICVSRRQVRPWESHEVDLLRSVGAQLAIAIDQAELYAQSRAKSQELQQTLQELQRTQSQMVQSEKMSSLGQLVAGIAHEINNPVNFIHGNVSHAGDYVQDILELLELYQHAYPSPPPKIADKIEEIDLEFLSEDVLKLLSSMRVGTERIREIVKSLRIFSRLDEAEVKPIDIHDGIDSTLMILHNRIKAKPDRGEIQVIKHYGKLPQVECFAGQLNQVFMNILVNAIDALEERDQMRSFEEQKQSPSTIEITTRMISAKQVSIHIRDNGAGMPESTQQRIFDPFFTTKAVGKGTGMGMSISYQIITERHHGQLRCVSQLGEGTEFIIQIPVHQYVENM